MSLPAHVAAARGSLRAHPLTPTGLVVDGRQRPLNVERRPTFSWLPRDAAGNERQTAYQLVVYDALSSRRVWNSGKVRSSRQSYLLYAGPALRDGRQYTWTVRTWNRQGIASPFAPRGSFDTGLLDNEWSGAQWVRRVTTGNDSTIDYTLARREVHLRGHRPIVRARAYVAAEGLWQLHVNGHVVDTQYDYQAPGETYYAVEDLTRLVRAGQLASGRARADLTLGLLVGSWPTTEGENRMEGPVPYETTLSAAAPVGASAITVAGSTGFTARENIALGAPGSADFEVATITSIVGGTLHLAHKLAFAHAGGGAVVSENGPSGMLIKVVLDYAGGKTQTIVSDERWTLSKDTEEVNDNPTLRSGENAGTFVEYVDRRLARTGWDRPGYNTTAARGWAPATSMGRHPLPNPGSCANYLDGGSPCGFTHLVPMQSRLSYRVVHPVSVRRLADGTLTADFGTGLVGIPVVRFAAGTPGRAVTLRGSYRLDNTTLVAPAPAGSTTIQLANRCGFEPGDHVSIDAPADGYGAGDPEQRTIVSLPAGSAPCGIPGPATIDTPLTRTHGSGVWVEGSRAGTSTLDTQDTDLSFHYTQAAGPQTTDFFVGEGFRYLEIDGAHENLAPSQIWVLTTHEDAPPPRAAALSTSNPTLNAVFGLMQRSALYAGQEEFNDSPDRQDGQFLMDTVDESMATMESLGERTLTREAIENFIASQRRYWLLPGPQYGDINAVYPDGDGKRDIPDFTEAFPEWVWRYYTLTGDSHTLALAYPVMQRIAAYVKASTVTSGADAGLVEQLAGGGDGVPGESLFPGFGSYQYGIVDWPPPMRYDTTVLNAGIDTVVNLRAAEVYRAAAAAATALGDRHNAGIYASDLSGLTATINRRLVEPSGLYDDGIAPGSDQQIGHASEHDQSFAVAYGVAPASMDAAIGGEVASQGMRQGPMDLGQLEQALIDVDRPDVLVSLLTDAGADGPAKILAENGTLMWEQWDPGCSAPGGGPGDDTASCTGAAIQQSSSDSFSHGWGAVGIVGILRGLLGITVTSPGAASVSIAPPGAGLAFAGGSEWTERGRVNVRWQRNAAGAYAITVTVPDNVTATVAIPDPLGRPYTAHGDGGARALGVSGGRARFAVGSGQTSFSPSR